MRTLVSLLRLMTGLEPGGLFSLTLVVSGSGVAFSFLAWHQIHWTVAAFFAVLACLPLLVLLRALLFLPGYWSWQTRLPFPVTGNFSLIANDRSDSNDWRYSTLSIELEHDTLEQRRNIEKSLQHFCEQANKGLYKTRWGKISPWQQDGLAAAGDANARTAWKIYRFIRGEIRALHKSGTKIARIDVSVAGEVNHVPAESDLMN